MQLKRNYMGTKDLVIARRFKELVERRITPQVIKVFGSRARGTASEDSDLDIFVSIDHCTREIEKYISDCAWEAGFIDDVVVVPIVVDQAKLESGPLRDSVFIRNLYREGISL
jgi:predicted nucleotidyltransferase